MVTVEPREIPQMTGPKGELCEGGKERGRSISWVARRQKKLLGIETMGNDEMVQLTGYRPAWGKRRGKRV